MSRPVLCYGPHSATVQLGTVDGDGDPVGQLCEDCGDVYSAAVDRGRHRPGRLPSADLIADLLPGLRPTGWVHPSPPPPPSWAKAGDPAWPPRKRPANVPAPDDIV